VFRFKRNRVSDGFPTGSRCGDCPASQIGAKVSGRGSRIVAPVAPVIVLAAVLAPGCGGDDRRVRSSDHGGALRPAEYRERANAICREEKRKVSAIPRPPVARNLDSWFAKQNAVELRYERMYWALPAASQPEASSATSSSPSRSQVAASSPWVKKLSRARNPARTLDAAYRKLRPRNYQLKALSAQLGLDDCAY
jgi:hypothetical protein